MSDFKEKKFGELRKLANERGIGVPVGTNKAALIEMLYHADEGTPDEPEPIEVPDAVLTQRDMELMTKQELLDYLKNRYGYTYPGSEAVYATRDEVKKKILGLESGG